MLAHLGNDSLPAQADDPPAQLFTEEITFTGGPYLIFPGTSVDVRDTLRWLLTATCLESTNPELDAICKEATCTAVLCLASSNIIAYKAGIGRGIAPYTSGDSDIVIPEASDLRRVSEAVTFSRSELVALIQDEAAFEETIEPLTCNLGVADWTAYSVEFGQLHHRPFVRAGDTYVVPNPSSLLLALRHRLLCIAQERGVLPNLSAAFGSEVWREIKRLLGLWRTKNLRIRLPQPLPKDFFEGLYSIDSDKVLYVQLATDNLRDFAGHYEPSKWEADQLTLELVRRRGEVVENLTGFQISSNKILALTVLQSAGRWFIGKLGDRTEEVAQVAMTASELRYLTLLEGNDALGLWKFTQAQTKIRQRARLVRFDFLDEYAAYRDNNHGYYFSDEHAPTDIVIPPGTGFRVRQAVSDRLDPHAVPTWTGGHIVEVWSLFGEGIPISFPLDLLGTPPAMVVEGKRHVPVWVTATTDVDDMLRRFLKELVEAVAYWLWQFEPLVVLCLSRFGNDRTKLVIQLDLDEPWRWVDLIKKGAKADVVCEPIVSFFERTEAGIKLALHHSLLVWLKGANNLGERQLIRELFLSLKAAYQDDFPHLKEVLSASKLETHLDSFAPLGQKKKIILPPDDPILNMGNSRLPRFRTIQEHDIEELLDAIGEHSTSTFGEGMTFQSKEERNEVINSTVSYLYRELEQLVSSFDGTVLLTTLISQNEVNVAQTKELELTTPTRAACFTDREGLLRKLTHETADRDEARLANRFLIEYVAARPPHGTSALSMEAYDRLLALAKLICDWGMLSDFIHFGLVEYGFAILPSGRLGSNHSDYKSARTRFMLTRTREGIAQTQRHFASQWRDSAGVPKKDEDVSPHMGALDEAFAAEFDVSLTDLIKLLADIINIGWGQMGPVKQMAFDELVASLAHSMEWETARTRKALDFVILSPRSDFFSPTGVSRSEVYPWRFNRAWSHLRRPLIQCSLDETPKILWGNRQLVMANEYVRDLCFSGRIKAKSKDLKRVVGEFRKESSEAFERTVGQVVTEITGIQPKMRFRKVGKHKIMADGKELGDIDVLGIVPNERTVLCIECKSLSLARTPAEIQHHMKELIEDSQGKPSTIRKHLERVKWVESNLDDVLSTCFGISRKGKWKVKPILVSDKELYAPYLRRFPFSVCSLETLRGSLPQELASNKK